MPAAVPPVSVEQFAAFAGDDGYRYELVAGRIIRMSPPGARHGVIATRIAMLLGAHAARHHLGVVLTPGGFVLDRDPDTVREPDVAFVCRERVPESGIPESFWPGAPDLAVEILSPSDRGADVRRKVTEYLTSGTAAVWVVDSKSATVTVHRRLFPPVRLSGEDLLEAGDLLPGFQCRVREIFA